MSQSEANYRTSARAVRDIVRIIAYSRAHYGDLAAHRYESLLRTAMRDIGDEPYRSGSRSVPGWDGAKTYHIAFSAERAAAAARVQRPTHKLVYEIGPARVVRILAVVGEQYPAGMVKPRRG